jgi:type II secretory pathway pseudopilin PulG
MFQFPRSKNAHVEAGFTTIELMLSVVIIGIVLVAAFVSYYNALPSMRADAAMQLLQAQLRQAREISIDQRRNVTVTFQGTREFVAAVQSSTTCPASGGSSTQVYDYFLQNSMVYMLFTGVGDTTDAYGNSAAVTYNCSGNTLPCTITFQSDGSVLDGQCGSSNGSIFIGIAGQPQTARAVTILSPTGKIKAWRYNGTAWH